MTWKDLTILVILRLIINYNIFLFNSINYRL